MSKKSSPRLIWLHQLHSPNPAMFLAKGLHEIGPGEQVLSKCHSSLGKRYVEVWQIYPIYPPKIMRISRPGKWRQMFLSKFWLVPIPCWIQGWKVVSPAKVDFRFWPRKLQTLKIPDVFQRDTSVALQTSRYIMVSCCFQPPSERCFLSPPTGGWVTIFSSLLHCNPRGSRLEPQQGVRIKEQKSTSWYIGIFHI